MSHDRMPPGEGARDGAAPAGLMWQNTGWMDRRWKETLDSFAAAGGDYDMTHANQTRIESMQMSLGEVRGFVDADYDFFETTVRFRKIGRSDWAVMARKLLSHPATAAKILAHMVEEDIEEAFREEGLDLFPQKDGISAECTCGHKSGHCDHTMAILFEIGHMLSLVPSAIFAIRGIAMQHLVDMGGFRLMPERAFAEDRRDLSFFDPCLDELPRKPAPKDLGEFWGRDLEAYDLGHASVPRANAVLPKQLGDIPFWEGGEDFVQTMEGVYGAASEAGMRAFLGETGKGRR